MEITRDHKNIISAVLKLANLINEFDKVPRKFGTDKSLYSSEIHTIAAIGDNSECNVTQLSKILGIKKPSVSEILKKLETKNIIEKNKKPENKKEIYLTLKEQGETAYREHLDFHKKMYSEIANHMDKLSSEMLEEFNLSLSEINLFLENELKREEQK